MVCIKQIKLKKRYESPYIDESGHSRVVLTGAVAEIKNPVVKI
jgi:hypothetical protein